MESNKLLRHLIEMLCNALISLLSDNELLQLQGEVNCVKWDPTGSLLASCSDDITAKVIFVTDLCLIYHSIVTYFQLVLDGAI